MNAPLRRPAGRVRLRFGASVWFVAVLACCQGGRRPSGQPLGAHGATYPVRLLGNDAAHPLLLWLACSDAQHARGLMGVHSLAPADGMLFVFAKSEPRSFWMHNTLLSLDMLFFGADGRLHCVVDSAEPQTDAPRSCVLPSRYVIELAGGTAARWGVGPGSRIEPEALAAFCLGTK